MSCIFSHNKEIKKEQVDKTGIRGGMVPILLCVSDFPDDGDSTPDLSWYIHNITTMALGRGPARMLLSVFRTKCYLVSLRGHILLHCDLCGWMKSQQVPQSGGSKLGSVCGV